MSIAGRMRSFLAFRSISGQYTLVVLLTVATVGLAGFFAGSSILTQIASLVKDQPLIEALGAGQHALVDLHRERRQLGEATALVCAKRNPDVPCTLPGGERVRREVVAIGASPLPYWEGESVYVMDAGGMAARFTFPWPEIKPLLASVTSVIGTREHLDELLPSLTESFLMIYALALVGAGLLGLVVTYFLSRRLGRRIALLVAYTRRIASGALEPAPAETGGADEVGTLASALHSMAHALDEARQRLVLNEKMQSWQNVARKVAHEIKNPLTPISLVASELKRHGANATDERTRTLLAETSRILEEETGSLGRMVREFSAFARLPEPDLIAADLLEILKDFAQRNSTDGGPILIINADREQPFPAVVDRAMILQVLHNLLNNARLAKAPAQVTVTLTLSRSSERTYLLDVIDDGPGVPETLKQTLFDAYVTTRSTGDGEKGMGLGLTIARKIASDHGGSLNLHSTGADGTCFRMVLPASTKWQAE